MSNDTVHRNTPWTIAQELEEAGKVWAGALEEAERAGIHVPNAFESNELLWEAIDRAEADSRDLASFRHTLPLIAGDTAPIPAILTRSDGRTLLYESRLNSIFGEPGLGKSWVALIAVIEVVRAGARAIFWDFEDAPSTLVSRLTALGAGDLIESGSIVYATPSLAEGEEGDRDEMRRMNSWMARGERPGLVVIDSVESAGLPTDSNNVAGWFVKHVDPWLHAGVSVLCVDHVPKRVLDRPRGAIGSQHKGARISGAGLALSGTPWTKTSDGKVKLVNHKDRQGDLPSPINKTVAVVTVTHGVDQRDEAELLYTIDPPDLADEDEDVSGQLLEAIASYGHQGVRTHKTVRSLVKARGEKVNVALEDLLKSGLVTQATDGRASVFVVTPEGQTMLDVGE